MVGHFGTARRRTKRNQLRMRDGDNCWLCGTPMRFSPGDGLDPEFATLDHVIPKSKGGTLILSNLRLAHGRCNKARADRDSDRYRGADETQRGSVPEGDRARADRHRPDTPGIAQTLSPRRNHDPTQQG